MRTARFSGRLLGGDVCLGGGSATPPFGQTDTCENITLPQTSFAGGKNVDSAKHAICNTLPAFSQKSFFTSILKCLTHVPFESYMSKITVSPF